jgi:ATP-binding cassette subfamily B protein
MLKRFISYYKPHRLIFTLDMLASLGMSVIGIFYPIVLRRMLNDFIPNKQLDMIITFALVLCGLYLVRMGLNYFIQYEGHVMGVRMQAQMRRRNRHRHKAVKIQVKKHLRRLMIHRARAQKEIQR